MLGDCGSLTHSLLHQNLLDGLYLLLAYGARQFHLKHKHEEKR